MGVSAGPPTATTSREKTGGMWSCREAWAAGPPLQGPAPARSRAKVSGMEVPAGSAALIC